MPQLLRSADVAVILGYLAVMAGIAVYFSRRNNTTEGYFLGNRQFSGWVIGLSMLGTVISSATFIALPAAAFILDWRQLAVNFALPFVAVAAVILFIPFFRRSGMTTAFEYLGHRYGPVPRLYGTISFIVMQAIRMAQILFLVSLPIQFITGASIGTVIVIAGIFIALYTVVGGIEAVIWTDVIQAVVMIAGAVICVCIVVLELPGGVGQIFDVATSHNKFSLGSFDFDATKRTFWTVSILGVVNWLAIYASDQNVVQRYVASRSLREARKATLIFSTIALPVWAFFFFLGTSVFVYYLVFPDPAVAALEADQVLPYYILTQVPMGLAGLLIAAVLAAAMSSLDSGVNSVSTVVVVDIFKPFLKPGRSDKYYLWVARISGMVVAAVVVVGALVFSGMNKESMNDVSLIVTSIFGGCVMGLFLLGFFTTRVDGISATIAIGASVVLNLYLGLGAMGRIPESLWLGVHSYWIGPIVNIAFVMVGFGLATLRRAPAVTTPGLTVWVPPEHADK